MTDTNERQVNVPLLRKAVEWAEAEAAKPERKSEWYQGGVVTDGEILGRDCGTAFCIAGYVAWQQLGSADDYYSLPEVAAVGGVMTFAQHELGLDNLGADELFSAHNAIEDVRRIAESLAGERL